MNSSPWKTGTITPRRVRLTWPSLGQLFRQVIVIVLLAGLWAALLAGYLRLSEGPAGEEAEEAVAQGGAAAEATAVPPTDPPVPSPTLIPSSTPTLMATLPAPAANATPAAPGVEETALPSPSPVPSETPTPLPPPTEAPVNPTEPAAPENEGTDEAALEGEPPGGDPATVSFANDILPIFERRCVKCHGGEKTEEGLVLKSHAEVLAGSWNGPVIEPGNLEESFLIEQIVKGKMPKKGPRLLPAEIRLISAWVEAGAPNN